MKSKFIVSLIVILCIAFCAGCSSKDDKSDNAGNEANGTVSDGNKNESGQNDQVGSGEGKTGDSAISDDKVPGSLNGGGQNINSSDLSSYGIKGSVEPKDLFADKKPTDVTEEEYVIRIDALKETRLDLGAEFEGFQKEVNFMYDAAVDYMKIGAAIPSIYGFTFAQGSVTSMRYAVGLLIKEKGDSVSEEGLICDWDEIYGLNLSTPVPYFMESVFVEKTDKEWADTLRGYGTENPIAKDMIPDIDKLKGLSIDELKNLYNKLVDYEKKLYELCIYVPQIGERTRFGFSSEAHIVATMWYLEQDDLAGAAEEVEKVVLTNPFSVDSYVYAAYINLAAGDIERALYFVNNGLLLDELNGDVNLFAALIAYGAEDIDAAKDYLKQAKSAGVSDQYKGIQNNLEAGL